MAGSSAVFLGLVRGAIDGALAVEKSYPVRFVADDTTGAFPVYTIPAGLGGSIIDYSFAFGDPAPNALAYVINDENGLLIASGSLSQSSGRDNLGATIPIMGGTITLTGNTTPSAEVLGTIYLVS